MRFCVRREHHQPWSGMLVVCYGEGLERTTAWFHWGAAAAAAAVVETGSMLGRLIKVGQRALSIPIDLYRTAREHYRASGSCNSRALGAGDVWYVKGAAEAGHVRAHAMARCCDGRNIDGGQRAAVRGSRLIEHGYTTWGVGSAHSARLFVSRSLGALAAFRVGGHVVRNLSILRAICSTCALHCSLASGAMQDDAAGSIASLCALYRLTCPAAAAAAAPPTRPAAERPLFNSFKHSMCAAALGAAAGRGAPACRIGTGGRRYLWGSSSHMSRRYYWLPCRSGLARHSTPLRPPGTTTNDCWRPPGVRSCYRGLSRNPAIVPSHAVPGRRKEGLKHDSRDTSR
jgi:hypothetical protein